LAKAPKYIFMLIGDGMSAVQVNAAQVLNGNNTSGEVSTHNLLFSTFPACGMATTHDSTSFCRILLQPRQHVFRL
jgi:alkaline phosphatase